METPVQNAVLVTVTSNDYNRIISAIGEKYRHLIQDRESTTGWYYEAQVRVALTYAITHGIGTLLAVDPANYGSLNVPAFFPFNVVDHGSGRIRLLEINVDTLKACGTCPARVAGSQRPALTPADVLGRMIDFIDHHQAA